jgi:hypothetical protein
VTVAVGSTQSPASLLVLSASPTTLPAGGGTANLTASVYDTYANPVAGISVVFSTTSGALGVSGAVATDATGRAFNTLTTSTAATVTATTLPSSVSDSVAIAVGGVRYTLSLSASLTSITTSSPPSPDPCTTGVDPQVPVTLRALLLDASGNPVDGQIVTFGFSPNALFKKYGQFCPTGSPPQGVTGASGTPGEAEVLFTVSNTDVISCAGSSPACSDDFVAKFGGVTSNTVTVTFTP